MLGGITLELQGAHLRMVDVANQEERICPSQLLLFIRGILKFSRWMENLFSDRNRKQVRGNS